MSNSNTEIFALAAPLTRAEISISFYLSTKILTWIIVDQTILYDMNHYKI